MLMKYQRVMLIAGVFLTGYLLLLQWQADYGGEKQQVDYEEEERQADPLTPLITERTGERETSPPSTTESQELLSVPEEQQQVLIEEEQLLERIEQPALQEKDVISVETDKLRLRISKKGGDIVSAAIKDHRQSRDSTNPLLLLRNDRQRLATAQSGLIGRNGFDATVHGRPIYTATQDSYSLREGEDILRVPLRWTQDGVTLVKEFVLQPGKYQLDVNFYVDNQGASPWQANMFAQFRRDDQPPLYADESFGIRSFTGAALTLNEKAYKKLSFKDMRKSNFQETVRGGWMAMVQHYYVAAWVPVDVQRDYVYSTDITSRNEYIFGFTAPAFRVSPGQQAQQSLRFYVGPKSQSELEALAPKIALTIDYGWLWYISQPLFRFLNFIYEYVGNWGVAIVIMTFIIKLVFLSFDPCQL